MWIPLACKDSEGSTDKYDRQDAICLSFKFFYGWTPFVCRCARRGAGARNGRAGAGGGDGACKVVLVVASGGAVGEVLDEALVILLASPPRGCLAASSLSTPAPGLDSGLACAVSRRAVRGGADPALRAPPRETDKVYTWFAIGFQEEEKVCSKFTCRFALCGKKFVLGLQLVFRKPKKFALSLPASLHAIKMSLYFVCTWFAIGLQEAEKVHMSVCIQ